MKLLVKLTKTNTSVHHDTAKSFEEGWLQEPARRLGATRIYAT